MPRLMPQDSKSLDCFWSQTATMKNFTYQGDEDDEETGASSLWGKAAGAGAVQP